MTGFCSPRKGVPPMVSGSSHMQDIFERMQRIIAEQFSVEEDEITMDTSFEEDLGADSVDLVELVMSMEEAFDIGEVQEDELSTLLTGGQRPVRIRPILASISAARPASAAAAA